MKCLQRLWPTLLVFHTLSLWCDCKFINNNYFLLLLFLCNPSNSNITFSPLSCDFFRRKIIICGDTTARLIVHFAAPLCPKLTIMLVDYLCWSSEVHRAVRSDDYLRLLLSIKPFRELFLEIGRWLRFDGIINLWKLRLSSRTLLLRFFLTAIHILAIIDPM